MESVPSSRPRPSPTPRPVAVDLFVTCVVDQFFPEVGEATVALLRRLGVDVAFPEGQTCCGQPAFNTGYWSQARDVASRFLNAFAGDRYVVAPSGSCVSMARAFYRELFEGDAQRMGQVEALAPRVYELTQFLMEVLGVSDLSPWAREEGPVTVTYHEACHLRRELGVVDPPRQLLMGLPGVRLAEMDQADVCCGFGGTFAVKYADISSAMLRDKLDAIEATGAQVVVSCDASCLMHIGGGLRRRGSPVRPQHIASFLARRLGLAVGEPWS